MPFTTAVTVPQPRAAVSISGGEFSGKTTLALKAPKPLNLLTADINTKRVLDALNKAAAGDQKAKASLEQIQVARHILRVPPETQREETGYKAGKISNEAAIQKLGNDWWKAFRRDALDSARDKKIRSLVIDGGTAVWQNFRLARFGRAAQVPPNRYVDINAEFGSFLEELREADPRKVIIITHKESDEYETVLDNKGEEKSKSTGRKKVDAYKHLGYYMEVMVRMFVSGPTMNPALKRQLVQADVEIPEENTFGLRIENCGPSPFLSGEVIWKPTFVKLMMKVYPETAKSDWM